MLEVLEKADKDLRDSDGQPVALPVNLAGDKGYRAEWIDEALAYLGINSIIPSELNEEDETQSAQFNRGFYRRRKIIERSIGWLRAFRRVFSRFKKKAINYAGTIKTVRIER